MQAQSAQREYFNLHTSGIGYLNRIRWVSVKGRGRSSEPFLACSIGALRGPGNGVEYTSFDVRVNGEEAISIIDGLQDTVNSGAKVIVSFRIGDIYPHLYERQVKVDGRPTGEFETACLIKGRLLLINSVSVNGEKVYERAASQEEAAASGNGASAPEQPPHGDDSAHGDSNEQAQAFDRGHSQEQGGQPAPEHRPVQRPASNYGQRPVRSQSQRYGSHREHSYAE